MHQPTLPDPAHTEEVSPEAVAHWLDLPPGSGPVLIDCREAEELQIGEISGAMWIPLAEMPSSVEMIRGFSGRGVIVSCHHGMRSLRAARFLRQQGIEKAFSMAGGIDAWSCQVDDTVPRY